MILTVDVPDKIHRKLEADKRQTGMSKSLIVRKILTQHYGPKKAKASAA